PWSMPGSLRLRDSLERGARGPFVRHAPEPTDIAILQYTGGTTGQSKVAVLTHGNVGAHVMQGRSWLRSRVREGEELIVTALPLYHSFSLTANCLVYSSLGAANLLITNPRDIAGFTRELRRYRFTAITGVNTLFNALLNHPDFARVDFSSLRIALGGGM